MCVFTLLAVASTASCSHQDATPAPLDLPPGKVSSVPAGPTSTSLPDTTSRPTSEAYPISVTVLNYCRCEGPRNQFQVKVKLKLVNTGVTAVNVGITNLRAMVRGPIPPGWTGFKPVIDQPSEVNIDGATYAVFPANQNRQAEPLEPGYQTWASFWNAHTLAPQDEYVEDGPNRGDVVFYVPLSPGQRPVVDGVGVVSDDGNRVLGWAPVSTWPPVPGLPPAMF